MHAEVYANQHIAAQTEPRKILKDADNYLNLLPEHRNEINNQWLSHLSSQRVSGNGIRILTSIYRHTVGFNKIEDDMSGTRLQQISCIRADHANHTLKLLAADHAIVCRDGRYGQILSINFDFSSWGKTNKKQTSPKLINDPRHLLPTRYHDEPIDTGNIVGSESVDSTPEYTNHNPPQNSVATTTTDTDAIAQNLQKNTQIIEQLFSKLEHLEEQVQTLSNTKKLFLNNTNKLQKTDKMYKAKIS